MGRRSGTGCTEAQWHQSVEKNSSGPVLEAKIKGDESPIWDVVTLERERGRERLHFFLAFVYYLTISN